MKGLFVILVNLFWILKIIPYLFQIFRCLLQTKTNISLKIILKFYYIFVNLPNLFPSKLFVRGGYYPCQPTGVLRRGSKEIPLQGTQILPKWEWDWNSKISYLSPKFSKKGYVITVKILLLQVVIFDRKLKVFSQRNNFWVDSQSIWKWDLIKHG